MISLPINTQKLKHLELTKKYSDHLQPQNNQFNEKWRVHLPVIFVVVYKVYIIDQYVRYL
jgi:hypothetical protein